jgi:hypothetical protein
MEQFGNVIDEEALDALTLEQLSALDALLTKGGY